MVEFEQTYQSSNDRLLLPHDRASGLFEAAKEALAVDGEFWECGVYRGGSARILADLLRDRPRPLRLFDTFSGFHGVTRSDRPGVSDGHLFYSEDAAEEVRRFLDADFVSIYKASIPKGFEGLESARIAFANIDVDLYKPTRDALRFILPRMVKGGRIVVDDYDDPDWPGVTQAVNELGVGGFSFSVSGTQARISL